MEEIQVSERFNASDADVILISSDNIQFKVHKINLITASTIFKDMFETGSSEEAIPKIELEESGGVLEVILPYAYPTVEVKDFDLKSNYAIGAMRAIIKYWIFFGVKSIELALAYSNLKAYDEIFFGYSFAILSGNDLVRLRMFNNFLHLSPKLGRVENVSDSAVQILDPLEMVQLQQEWAIRVFYVSGLYQDLTNHFFSELFKNTHAKNDQFRETKCDNKNVFRRWNSLTGVISSKVVEELKNEPEVIDCSICRSKLFKITSDLQGRIEDIEGRLQFQF